MNANERPTIRVKREINTGDMEIGQRASILLPNDGPLNHEPESIAAIDSPLHDDYTKALIFNEEILTIRLERSSEKFAPQIIDVYCNGKPLWIPVGKPWMVPRKYVEILARAKPDSVQTDVVERDGEDPQNRINRFTSAKHPFSVINDPNPMGFEWLTRVMQEA